MPFDWAEFMGVAKAHIGQAANPSDEAKDRCAMSRAYYAAFKKTHGYISSTRPSVDLGEAGDAHARLPRWLKDQQNRDLSRIGEHLVRLKRRRKTADYDDTDMSRSRDLARDAIRMCNEVLQTLDSEP